MPEKYCKTVIFKNKKPTNIQIFIWDICLPAKFLSFLQRYFSSTQGLPGPDAGACHCCQCSTLKWLTLISKVEFSFIKMLWARFSNLPERSCKRHCSETLTSVGGCNFSCCSIFNTTHDFVLCTKFASLFSNN